MVLFCLELLLVCQSGSCKLHDVVEQSVGAVGVLTGIVALDRVGSVAIDSAVGIVDGHGNGLVAKTTKFSNKICTTTGVPRMTVR